MGSIKFWYGICSFCRVWELYSEYGIGVGLISEFSSGIGMARKRKGKGINRPGLSEWCTYIIALSTAYEGRSALPVSRRVVSRQCIYMFHCFSFPCSVISPWVVASSVVPWAVLIFISG